MSNCAGEHKGPEVTAINPRGQVPTLVDGTVVVCESVAALLYLEDAYPEHKLLPTDGRERAAVSQPSQGLLRSEEALRFHRRLVAVNLLGTELHMEPRTYIYISCGHLCFCAAAIALSESLPFTLSIYQKLRAAEIRECLICKQAYQRTVESANLQEKVFALIRLKVQLPH